MANPDSRFYFPREVHRGLISDKPLQVQGTVKKVKSYGENLAFANLPAPDRVLQVTAVNNPEVVAAMSALAPGTIALFEGILAMRAPEYVNEKARSTNPELFDVELGALGIDVIQVPKKPAQGLTWENARKSNYFDADHYLEVTRMPEFARMLLMRNGMQDAFIEHFKERGFTRIPVPSLTASTAEGGGAEVFRTRAGNKDRPIELSLVQSPQQMKQMMSELFGAAVWTGSAFRNDPSTTPWHLSEFTGLDMEQQVHYRNRDLAFGEIIGQLTDAVFDLHAEMAKHPQVFKDNGNATLPLLPKEGIPSIPYEQAMALARKAGIRDWSGEWDRAAEKAVADFVRKTYHSDYYFITHFPFKEKVFYTDTVNIDDPNTATYSFDLVCRGVEIASGGLRVNDPDKLRRQIAIKKEHVAEENLHRKPGQPMKEPLAEDAVALYLQHFERAASQTGGFGIGLERYMALILGTNSRLMAPFPKTYEQAVG